MNVSDFTALLGFLASFFASIFTALDSVVIVTDGTTKLTLLGFCVAVGFVFAVLRFIKWVSE